MPPSKTKSTKGALLYEGKAKQIFEGPEPGTIVQHFKDDATAFNNQKKGTISGKGVINNRISERIMLHLEEMGIPTHFIRTINMREQLVRAVEIVPLEVVVRNRTAGSFSKRFGIPEGEILPYPIVECYLKSDELGDPLLTDEHIFALDLAEPYELEEMYGMALRINDFLTGLFMGIGIRLVDFKLEFGRFYEEDTVSIILADEITPDNCRLWDMKTGEKMDKDRFRQDLGAVQEAYQEVARRLGVMPDAPIEEPKTTKTRAKTSSGRSARSTKLSITKPRNPKGKGKKK